MSHRLIRPAAALGAAVILVAGLAGCASSSSSSSGATSPSASTSAAALSITDPWVKAADSGMTAAFGTLVNGTSSAITVVSATTTASPVTELHETVMKDGQMAMQPVEGGFTVPANGSFELKPGGNHIMIMDLTTPVKPGDEVTVTLKLSDGSTVPFTAVAKEYSGGNEPYHSGGASPSMSMSGMG